MKYALVIGNNQYDDRTLSQLKTPPADIQALADVLQNPAIGGFDSVVPLLNQSESQIRREIGSLFSNKKPDDLLLLYFSGHGILDDRGRLYLATKDTQQNLIKATAIPSTFVTDEMDGCRSKRQILILDCCHSGAFARGAKGNQKAVTQATFEGSGYGRVVLTASDSTQYAFEGSQVITGRDELSLFTHHLLSGLKTGVADANQDGLITLDELYDYTYTQIIDQTPHQTPQKWAYHQEGDLVIARNPSPGKSQPMQARITSTARTDTHTPVSHLRAHQISPQKENYAPIPRGIKVISLSRWWLVTILGMVGGFIGLVYAVNLFWNYSKGYLNQGGFRFVGLEPILNPTAEFIFMASWAGLVGFIQWLALIRPRTKKGIWWVVANGLVGGLGGLLMGVFNTNLDTFFSSPFFWMTVIWMSLNLLMGPSLLKKTGSFD